MLPLTLLTLLLPTSALPLNSHPNIKATAIPAYNITSFSAGAVILSHRVYYRFNVSHTPNQPPVECSALGTTLDEDLSSIPQTICGDPSTSKVSFKWTRHEDGSADLFVRHEVEGDGDSDGVTEEAIHAVKKNETVVVGSGQLAHRVYQGPEEFSIPAFRFHAS
ncbi:hypothetical protein B0T16DRAFT_452262 [Cercophora newfieldiana]|uniref:AA1-like domain-containing protein n=1 Tax=Cercophora newfieldiana TaxID=92897 RepID=A0AA39YRR2_9PEZI|nr:hypothetical protein B0T16DRAFT_452262 [Cercophora newfieldiana]